MSDQPASSAERRLGSPAETPPSDSPSDSSSNAQWLAKCQQLRARIAGLNSCAVAFSGGVDSAVVAAVAAQELGDRAVAVTAVSPSLATGEREHAVKLAAQIGIRHQLLATREGAEPGYVRNGPDRCFYCKSELYRQLEALAPQWGAATLLNGTNADDLGDYRPGLRAAENYQVLSPLAECGFSKADVRRLAAELALPVWDKPASPCLASRIAYGEEVTPERLRMVDQGEQLLKAELGLADCRVRYHRGDVARLEIPLPAIATVVAHRERIVEGLRNAGFKFVTLDLEGLRSGSLNALVKLELPGR